MIDRHMSILEHLLRLRASVLRASVFTIIMLVLALWYYQEILTFFNEPVLRLFEEANVQGGPISTRLTEVWSLAARIGFLIAVTASIPFYIVEVALYLRPALKPSERVYVFLLPPPVILLFAAGCVFAYYVLVPSFFKFLLTFSAGLEGIDIRPSISSTIGLTVSFMFWMGILFQTPILMLIGSKMGLVTFSDLASRWRWAVLIAFIFGAIITPTADPITQVLAAMPLVVLYGVGLVLMKIAERGQSQEDKEQKTILNSSTAV